MKEFKIRCHAISKIMSGSIGLTDIQKGKLFELETRKNDATAKPLTANMEAELATLINKRDNPELPAGAKSYCEAWVKEQIYQRRKEFKSKYTDKGLQVENDSLELIRDFLGLNEIVKNEQFFENDYLIGTPDVNAEFLIDNKASWDCFTFPLFDDEIPKDENYWQGQGYMDLTDRKECKFIYTLMDTPEKLIIQEAKSYCFKNGFEMDPRFVDEFRERMTYSNIEMQYRIKSFDVIRNDKDIQEIYTRVKLCRAYIQILAK